MKFFTKERQEALQKEIDRLNLAIGDAHNEYAEAFNEGLDHGIELTRKQVERLAAAEKVCKSCRTVDIGHPLGVLDLHFDLEALAAWKELAKDDEEFPF